MDFYHATSPTNVELIIANGFQLPTYWCEDDGKHWSIEGCLGTGIYVSKSWQTALNFGSALLRVQLVQGTRILDVSEEANMKVINSLKREFGKELLRADMSFHKIIPKNKQLTLVELVELTKYHFHLTYGSIRTKKQKGFHGPSLCQCESLLRRYKYDGYGHLTSDVGIIIFSAEKVKVKELVAVVRDRPYSRGKRKFDSLDDLEMYFHKKGDKKFIELAKHINIGND